MQSARQIFLENARRDPTRPALVDGDRSVSFGELLQDVYGVAAMLGEAGLEGKRVGILLKNEVGFASALYGIWHSGGSALLLNPANSPREIAEQIADSGVTEVFADEQLASLLPSDTEVLDAAAGSGSAAPAGIAVDPHSEAAVIFTSGMDGRARGAVLSHRNLTTNAVATAEALALSGSDRVIAALPFAHAFGLTVCLNSVLITGGTSLVVGRFHPITLFELIANEGATVLCGVPAIYTALLSVAEKKGVPKHDLRIALCGGAPLPRWVARQWEARFGIPLRQGYGLTEAAPVCLFNGFGRENRIGTLGTSIPGVDVRIRSGTGEELADGEVGEICVAGPNVFPGYLGDDRSCLRDGELRTGDLGTRADGYITFRGTIKKMFTRSGFNVYPEEIRRVLEADKRVERATVYGRPDPVRENDIVVELRLVPGARWTEEEIMSHCQQVLATYKQPTEIRFAESTHRSEQK